jgi:hypothetical protein
MPTWEVALRITCGLALVAVAGYRIVTQLRTRKYGADGPDWEGYYLNGLAMAAGFIGLGLIISASG